MRLRTLIIIGAVLIAETTLSQQVYLTRSGVASFVSNAPLEIIKAESNQVQGAINLTDRGFAFSIDIKSFKGFNSPLQQEHFYENYMEVQEFPTSTFKGKIIEEIDIDTKLEQEVRAKGILEIHGIAQERIIRGTIKIIENKIRLQANFTVLLEDHQIKIPRVVYQKIAEVIDINISAELIGKTE